MIPLYKATSGQWLRIHSVPPGIVEAHFLRVGIRQGERVKCLERLPGGTIVLQKSRQHIAVGYALAKKILVVVLDSGKARNG